MRIDLTDLLSRVGNEQKLEVNERVSFPEDELVLTEPLRGKLHLINTGGTVLLRGEIKTAARLICVRCLKEFDHLLAVELEEEFGKTKNFSAARRTLELDREDFIFPIAADNTVDLTETVRQNLLTALPIKPLCRADCGYSSGASAEEDKGEK